MSGKSVVPLPTVQYDWDFMWPTPAGVSIGDGFAVNGAERYGGGVTASAFWQAALGVGTTNMGSFSGNSMLCGQWANNAGTQIKRLMSYAMNLPLTKFGPAGTPAASWRRIFRLQTVLALQTPVVASVAPGLQTDVTFVGFTNVLGAGPDGPGNCYFGLALGTDGTWHWVTRQNAILWGLTDDVPGIIPAATIAVPHFLDFVVLAANGTNDAVCQLYLDQDYSAPVIQRSWGVGTKLPSYDSAGAATALGFVFMVGAEDTGQQAVVQVGPTRWMMGQYTPAGQAI